MGRESKVDFTRIDTPGYLSATGEELSNVDLAEELSSMIITQNGFAANVKMARAFFYSGFDLLAVFFLCFV